MSRWQRFLLALKSVPSRIDGSRVDLGAEHVTRLSVAAPFPPSDKLEQRINAARAAIPRKPDVERKTPFVSTLRRVAQADLIGDRVLVEDQPDYGESGMVTRRPIG